MQVKVKGALHSQVDCSTKLIGEYSTVADEFYAFKVSAVVRQLAINIEFEVKLQLIKNLDDKSSFMSSDGEFFEDFVRDYDLGKLRTKLDALKYQTVLKTNWDTDFNEFRQAMRRLKQFSLKEAHPKQYIGKDVTFEMAKNLINQAADDDSLSVQQNRKYKLLAISCLKKLQKIRGDESLLKI